MDVDVAETKNQEDQEAATKYSEETLYLSEHGRLTWPICSVRPPEGYTPVLTAHSPDGRFHPEGQLNEQHVYTFLRSLPVLQCKLHFMLYTPLLLWFKHNICSVQPSEHRSLYFLELTLGVMLLM